MINPFNKLKIKGSDIVLEIGSGHNPFYRSDILCDKYITNDERLSSLKKDRPIVLADCSSLPFKTKSIDYAICLQVLEHVEDPVKCCNEISRVAKSGYIETPAMFWEKLHPSRDYHKWFILNIDSTLVFVRKGKEENNSVFGNIFENMYSESFEYRMLMRAYPELFEVKYEWKDKINVIVNPKEEYYLNYFVRPWDKQQMYKYCNKKKKSKYFGFTVNLFNCLLMYLINKPYVMLVTIFKEIRRRKLKINLNKYLVCPKCKTDLDYNYEGITCNSCKQKYSYFENIPYLVLK